MRQKIFGILIVGLLMATIFPVGTSIAQSAEEKHIKILTSQIEITIKGGFSIRAFIKNTGTTDLNHVAIRIILDGRGIFPAYKDREATSSYKTGKTVLTIIPVYGFGETNIEITVDGTTATASAMVFGRIVFEVT